jgi:hypothetical protein
MKLTGPVNKHLEKINQSTNRILEILAKPQSNLTFTSFQNQQNWPLYKEYVKRKVNKLFIKLESRASLPRQDNLSEVRLKKLQPRIKTVFELDAENLPSDETSNQVLTRKSESNKSFSSKKSFSRRHLTPLDKRKVMKDYYYEKVKPHNSLIRRGIKD